MSKWFSDRVLWFALCVFVSCFVAAVAWAADPASPVPAVAPTSTVWRDFFSALLSAMLPLALAGVAWASKKLADLINAHVKNAQVSGILSRLNSHATAIVQEAMQTTVDSAKMAAVDGKLPVDVAKSALSSAVENLKGHLGEKGLAEVESVLGIEAGDDLNKFLITTIEAKVRELKMSSAAVLANAG